MADLKTIKIFLASSIVEFDRERDELQTYIARLNKEYMPRGIYFDLEVCENVTNALALSRKQDEYNDIIRQSRYVYLLVGERIGQYTEEEFDVALDQFRKTGAPLIYTYFKRLPEGAVADQSVAAFMQRLGEGIGHYWSEYSDLDSIKLNIILELMRDPDVGGVVQFEDGRALLNGEEMVSLENVPIYSGNSNLQAAKDELAQVEQRRSEVQAAIARGVALDALDPELTTEFSKLSARREELSEQIHQMEVAMLENLNSMVSKSRSGEGIDPRERKAAELVNAGKYDEANAVLSDEAWAKEVETAAEVVEGLREKARQYISGQEALITNLESLGVTQESAPLIEDVYEAACKVVEKWHVGFGVMCDYAKFLFRQRKYDKATAKLTWLVNAAGVSEVPPVVLARSYVVLGDMHLIKKQFAAAEEANGQAIRLLASCSEQGSAEELELAHAYICQCETLHASRLLDDAREMAHKGLEIMLRREDESMRDLGYAYNMLSLIESKNGNFDQAISLMLRAIHYRGEVAKSGKAVPLRSLSISYSNLATQYRNLKKYDEAETYCKKCLDIRSELYRQNPTANRAKYSLVLNNYSKLLIKTGRYEEAEGYVNEAIELRRFLAEDNPDVSLSGLAQPLNTKGELIRAAGWKDRYGEALEFLEEAYEIRKKVYEASPRARNVNFAETCTELARLNAEMGEDDAAGRFFSEAFDALTNPQVNDPSHNPVEYVETVVPYACFLHGQGDAARAEELMRKALETYERLCATHPEVYEQELAAVREKLDEITGSMR